MRNHIATISVIASILCAEYKKRSPYEIFKQDWDTYRAPIVKSSHDVGFAFFDAKWSQIESIVEIRAVHINQVTGEHKFDHRTLSAPVNLCTHLCLSPKFYDLVETHKDSQYTEAQFDAATRQVVYLGLFPPNYMGVYKQTCHSTSTLERGNSLRIRFSAVINGQMGFFINPAHFFGFKTQYSLHKIPDTSTPSGRINTATGSVDIYHPNKQSDSVDLNNVDLNSVDHFSADLDVECYFYVVLKYRDGSTRKSPIILFSYDKDVKIPYCLVEDGYSIPGFTLTDPEEYGMGSEDYSADVHPEEREKIGRRVEIPTHKEPTDSLETWTQEKFDLVHKHKNIRQTPAHKLTEEGFKSLARPEGWKERPPGRYEEERYERRSSVEDFNDYDDLDEFWDGLSAEIEKTERKPYEFPTEEEDVHKAEEEGVHKAEKVSVHEVETPVHEVTHDTTVHKVTPDTTVHKVTTPPSHSTISPLHITPRKQITSRFMRLLEPTDTIDKSADTIDKTADKPTDVLDKSTGILDKSDKSPVGSGSTVFPADDVTISPPSTVSTDIVKSTVPDSPEKSFVSLDDSPVKPSVSYKVHELPVRKGRRVRKFRRVRKSKGDLTKEKQCKEKQSKEKQSSDHSTIDDITRDIRTKDDISTRDITIDITRDDITEDITDSDTDSFQYEEYSSYEEDDTPAESDSTSKILGIIDKQWCIKHKILLIVLGGIIMTIISIGIVICIKRSGRERRSIKNKRMREI